MLVEFEVFHIDYNKERSDKDRLENLNQEYDEESYQEGYIARYICDISGPILEIQEVELSFKGRIYNVVTFTTQRVKTPYLNISYEDFISLLKQIDKNFNWLVRTAKKEVKSEKNGITV